MNTNLKSLIEKLNNTCRSVLEKAAGLCLSKTNFDVDLEHFLIKILEVQNTDFLRITQHFEINLSRLNRDLTAALESLKTGNNRNPALSSDIPRLLENAWLIASIDFGEKEIRSGHILLAMLTDERLLKIAREISKEFELIVPDTLKKRFIEITVGSMEENKSFGKSPSEVASSGAVTLAGKTRALDQFTIDLTERARKGDIDPVLGRDFEVRQIIDILIRRRQNNPILTGEAGVGKTAVVEGFALRVVQGEVPAPLKNVVIRTLDLGLLQAGAGIKGEFENRLKSVIEEVKSSPQPIILFIDEAHTMIGAGGQAGQSDAANLLKPALARGELRTIAATTWAEYKKYFEKDAALARRFQVVKIEEPNEEQAIAMMRGLVGKLQSHHNVRILDEAVIGAVKLSHRYITGRQLPDKCVSVLDTACARVAISQVAIPSSVEGTQHKLDQLNTELDSLNREVLTGTDHQKRISKISEEKANLETRLIQLKAQWDQELGLINQIRTIRLELENQATNQGKDNEPKEPLDKLQNLLAKLNQELVNIQGETPLMQACVDAQAVAEVISGWTGIPIGKMLTDEINLILTMKERLEQRIIGQSHALEAISRRIRTSRATLTDPRRPIGVFLLVGPSGVGKTETGLALAELLYGGERNLISINMSEYQEAYTVSSLKGSPPGYVGYGEGGVLTEAVRRKPYSVILLDEVEKAHPDVMELFYQVFDKGILEDAEGREIDFKNTVILLTSNVGTDTIMKLCADPDTTPLPDKLVETLRPELIKAFKPALLGRMIVIPYFPISDQVMKLIIKLQLGRIAKQMRENHNASFSYDESVINEIASRCREVESGARNVDHILTGTLLPEVAGEFLSRMAAKQAVSQVAVKVGTDSNFIYEIS
jgi:type VI secretion system protein VasG